MPASVLRPVVLGLLVALALSPILPGPLLAAEFGETIGTVSRALAPADAIRRGQPIPLERGDAIRFGDDLTTGVDGRLEVVFTDDTRLTLGERSAVTVDSYVFTPAGGEGTWRLLSGVFRMVTGEIARRQPDKVTVATPVATIGIRGTDFWGGRLKDNPLAVLTLDGHIEVSAPGGRISLGPGEGAVFTSAEAAPSGVGPWTPAQVESAVRTVRFPDDSSWTPRPGSAPPASPY
ncbi:FecR family protein [Roseospirillum parvum]|uniref:FecR protein n=1 Tax=Roseospirillum parvum TaxID=83401 RepID=A0A1G7UK33_9PROT|nr:FecR family protein [Roseospirillum parvum]SDG47718.1 FecR protein [Roseospirillum parvum]